MKSGQSWMAARAALRRWKMLENSSSDNGPSPGFGDAARRLSFIEDRIAKCLELSGRAPGSVRLTAVTKQRSQTEIEALILAGQRVFGENRVQEAARKWPSLREAHPNLELRLIGPLQSNKVREACSVFDALETLDRPSLAEALAREFSRTGIARELYIQVNVGDEPQKAGVSLSEADQFIERCRSEYQLNITGLMCIPPAGHPAAPYFALLSKIARRHALEQLSMGMSGDFEIAVQLGATRVRIGNALFEASR